MFTTPSILLRSRDVGEADRLFTFYTRDHGKIEALATGIRKTKSKLAGHCLPHGVIACTFFPGRERMRLVQASRKKSYHFSEDLSAFGAASYACEAVDVLTKPGITDRAIFELLVRLFDGLEKKKSAPHLLLHAFLFHTLSALGYRPKSQNVVRNKKVPTLISEYIPQPLASEIFLASIQHTLRDL